MPLRKTEDLGACLSGLVLDSIHVCLFIQQCSSLKNHTHFDTEGHLGTPREYAKESSKDLHIAMFTAI